MVLERCVVVTLAVIHQANIVMGRSDVWVVLVQELPDFLDSESFVLWDVDGPDHLRGQHRFVAVHQILQEVHSCIVAWRQVHAYISGEEVYRKMIIILRGYNCHGHHAEEHNDRISVLTIYFPLTFVTGSELVHVDCHLLILSIWNLIH